MYNSLAVHGHFYQPPRQDPFTGQIPKEWINGKLQNWNEKINEECYKTNANLGNFTLITFDMYRSLAEWLEQYDPETYWKIIMSDNAVYERDGIGTAMCGSWDHAILPLMTEDDIELEVYWGYADFIKRFKHAPIGFWLPETAVSRNVLDVLARNGMRLVILAPWQATHLVDTRKLYWVELFEGRRISVAFYEKEFSGALSFDNNAMANADNFAKQYLQGKIKSEGGNILGATDGERYGHHLHKGETFLNTLLTKSISEIGFKHTTILRLYTQVPIKDQVYIQENTAWSCLCGGLKRWKEDCECCIDYNNHNKRVSGEWKKHLFNAVRKLSESVKGLTIKTLAEVVNDPHYLIKEYIHVYLRQVTESEFIQKHKARELNHHDIMVILHLCKLQIYRLASFTSCGWFFDDIDRPEPRIVISNAKKSISMLAEIGWSDKALILEEMFLEELQKAKSNKTNKTGKDLYLEYKPIMEL